MRDIKNEIEQADYVLVGIGSEWKAQEGMENTILEAYNKLADILKDKNYYIVTTCYDDIIFDSDLKKEQITAPCGSIRRYQCENGCTGVIKSEDEVNKDSKCPVCGGQYVKNIVKADKYNEEGYMDSWKNYGTWLSRTLNRKVVILELGTDFTYPTVIRWAFEKVVMINNKAYMYRINEKFWQLTEEINEKAESIKMNSIDYINKY